MANPHRGEVSFEAEGASYTLRFSINEICELEAAFDKPVLDIAALLDPKAFRVTDLRAIFQIGLQQDVGIEQAGEILSSIGPAKGIDLVTQAFRLAFPPPEAKSDEARPPKARRGTGRRS